MSDQTKRREAVLNHFTAPDGYEIRAEDWSTTLANDFDTVGCDWAHWFCEEYGNLMSEAIEQLALKCERQRLEIERLQKELKDAVMKWAAAENEYESK